MSVWIYGYIKCTTTIVACEVRKRMTGYKEIGIREEPRKNLWNWPLELLPGESIVVCFSIHDQVGRTGAEHILNYVEYSPDATSPLPLDKDARLSMFLRLVNYLINTEGVSCLLIAITDSCEITSTKTMSVIDLSLVLCSDLEHSAPPNILYIVTPSGAETLHCRNVVVNVASVGEGESEMSRKPRYLT